MKRTWNNKLRRIVSVSLLSCLLTLVLYGCGSKDNPIPTNPVSKTTFMLNTIVSITLYDQTDVTILDEAFQLCNTYENIFSRTRTQSELYQLNHRTLPQKDGGYSVSDELMTLIKKGLSYGEASNGAFDITIAPVSSLWDFQALNPVAPDSQQIATALTHVNYKNVSVKDNLVYFTEEETMLDLGAIAKGYIADRIKDFLISKGVKSAMINLGGNVLCVGSKPDGSAFNIGIQKPYADQNETVAVMELKDKSVVSSGIYERFFEDNGKSYHHILNPKTGYSYDNDLVSVTIISDVSVDGDCLSTTCFALGSKAGLDYINSLDNVDAVFITKDYEMLYSDYFNERITTK